jgi:hypothetical protein
VPHREVTSRYCTIPLIVIFDGYQPQAMQAVRKD